jgi:hypothetical protein
MASSGVIYIPALMKFGIGVQTILRFRTGGKENC